MWWTGQQSPSCLPFPNFFAPSGLGRVVGDRHTLGVSTMEEPASVEEAMATYNTWGANALRAECRRLKVVPASLNKASYLVALRASLTVTETIQATGVVQDPFQQGTTDRRTADCMFRLRNVLFLTPKRADSVMDAFRELLSNEDRTLLAKRQIAFFDESITLKLQKSSRSETEHAVAMSVAALREKKEGVELLISLQRSLSEMRRTLVELTRSGRQQDDAE
ncbi:hypothetical protein GQ600_6140 [Phytophthora cactorum]|nr:hypothetical protein GQ600_6140 [Phytophthora cactorum]